MYKKKKNYLSFSRSCEPKTALIAMENGTSSGLVTPQENMKQIYELGIIYIYNITKNKSPIE